MRRLPINQKISERLSIVFGADYSSSNIAVFETVAFTTLPLSKPRHLVDGGKAEASLLYEMAEFVNSKGYVPLQLMHDTGVLPAGTIFYSEVHGAEDRGESYSELRHLFLVSLDTSEGQDLVAKIESGTINEVSVGFSMNNLKCSECDFDYMSADADVINWIDQTCSEGHVIGVDGVHVVISSLNRYGEMSLVTAGAAKNAKIQSKRQSKLLTDNFGLAASNKSDIITFKQIPVFLTLEGESKMPNENPVVPVAEVAEVPVAVVPVAVVPVAEVPVAEVPVAEVEQLGATFDKLVELTADNKILTAQVKTLELKHTEFTALKAEAEVNKKDLALCLGFIEKSYTHLSVASGNSKVEAPKGVVELLQGIASFQEKLSKLPTGGVSLAADNLTRKKDSNYNKDAISSYKTKK